MFYFANVSNLDNSLKFLIKFDILQQPKAWFSVTHTLGLCGMKNIIISFKIFQNCGWITFRYTFSCFSFLTYLNIKMISQKYPLK